MQHGKILEVGAGGNEPAVQTIDATGCIVTPGLIDHHAHLYPLIPKGIPAEAVCFASGVTTVVDAGSTGCMTLERHQGFLESTLLDVKAFLHVNSQGLASLPQLENVSPDSFSREGIRHAFAMYGDRLVGLKLRTSREIVGGLGLAPLEKSLELASELDVPLMVHCTDPPAPMDELLRMLRPGDILTHMYQNVGHTILDAAGRVSDEALRARARGVLFEAADARAHFSFAVAEAAIGQGFLPDLIATDLTAFSMYQRPTAFSLPMQLSKYVHLGIPLEEVIRRCTQNPAKRLGLSGTAGSLDPGRQADIAVFRPITVRNSFGDRPYHNEHCALREGGLLYQPVLTVKRGALVYRDITF